MALAFCLLSFPGLAPAETLGDALQLSRLGEPLRVVVPIRPDGSPPLIDRCLAVVAPGQSDGLPHILTANVAVGRDAGSGTVLVTTSAPVREPVVRLLLRTTCDGATRQYTLFLEPPGSTRQVRAVAQSGPRVGSLLPGVGSGRPADSSPGATSAGRELAPRTPASAPVVTVIPVAPAPTQRPAAVADPKPTQAGDAAPLIAAASPSVASPMSEPARTEAPSAEAAAPPAPPPTAALEAENQTLKQQVAALTGELQRLQQTPAPQRASPAAPVAGGTVRALGSPRWELAWPVLVALAGLAALIVGGFGFMWRRRHHPVDEWMLTGPPSHRVASRTSLAEEPVPFKQVGVRTDIRPEEAGATTIALSSPREHTVAPATLRLQPSADDLGRELEQELFIAERAHSALERAHPDIVDALTRCWGTAAARHQLARMLDAASPELARMSGEAVAELRLLMRIAEDPNPREDTDSAPRTLSPPAPAW